MKESGYSPKTMILNSLSFPLSMYVKVMAYPTVTLLLLTIMSVLFPTFVQHFEVQELF